MRARFAHRRVGHGDATSDPVNGDEPKLARTNTGFQTVGFHEPRLLSTTLADTGGDKLAAGFSAHRPMDAATATAPHGGWPEPIVSDVSRGQAPKRIGATKCHRLAFYGRRSGPRPPGLLEAAPSPCELRTASVYPGSLFSVPYTPKSQLNTVHAFVASDASGVDVQ